jgi:drug/metabolite transporter (DMT)-like permease
MIDRKIIKADLVLLLTAFIWGAAFVAQKIGVNYLPPVAFNGIRFTMGTLALLPFALRKRGNPHFFTREEIKGGLIAGILLALATNLQQYGIVHTTAGKAGFITGLYVVIVPFLGFLFRHKPGWGSWLGAFLALGGLFLLSVQENFTFARGDLWVLACALVFAFHVLVVSQYSPRSEPLRLALMQFIICSVLSLILAFSLEKIPAQGIKDALLPIVYAGVFSVGIGYTLQVVAQKDTIATHAAIIMSLEAVFAALTGWIFLGETLTLRAIWGCALMFSGAVVAQIKP